MSSEQALTAMDALARAGRTLHHYSCTPATDGNFSAKINTDTAVLTRSGTTKGELSEQDFLTVGLSDSRPEGASSEWLLHKAIYDARPEVSAVLHVHAPHLTAFAVAHRMPDIRLLAESLVLIGEIALVPFALPGTTEVGAATLRQSKTANVYLLSNHGAVSVGSSVEQALNRVLRAEFLARLEIQSALIGGAVPLDDAQVSALLGR